MKLFLGGLLAETNSFSPVPTGMGAFEEQGIRCNAASTADPMGMLPAILAARGAASRAGATLVEGMFAAAQPLGDVVDAVYRNLRSRLLNDLAAAMPLDAVVLMLHGAMISTACDDCEGDLLDAVRAIVGPEVPIGVSLDLHCHFTARMRAATPIYVAYKEYPHIDIAETAASVVELVVATVRGEISPVLEWAECPMMGLWPTLSEAMVDFVDRMRKSEKVRPLLSVSLAHGMAYGDVPEAGSGVWVVANGDRAAARAKAVELAQHFFAIRGKIGTSMNSLPEAVAQLAGWSGERPLALVDVADNPGGGAQGDSSFVLRALIEAKMDRVAVGGIWDPGAIQLCREAGIGATFPMRIGGKTGPTSGTPVDVVATVMCLRGEHSQDDFGSRADLGPSAWVRTEGGIDIVLISRRQQVLGVDMFTGLGLELDALRGVVVKSMQHFMASFGPHLGGVVHVDTPGLMRADFADIPFKRRSLNYWPRVANPFSH